LKWSTQIQKPVLRWGLIKHGEFLGEIILGVFILSGGGSVVMTTLQTCKTINFAAKTYKRFNPDSEKLFQESIDAISDAF